ncbi:hypothetical protein [Clostridium taeniosporum]|uniref:Cell division protein FtsZ n=1 Tax=Clostridium taeniosporum TaxID=394958 RepID=A0A1D7XLX2_9CLOT|nr:hypothetical protein [Clostridium taeniosporum]AOR24338.1 hypothetical protein BGI42_11595 [Clostridium taeniosporum]
MKYKVICLGNNIELKESSPALSFLEDNNINYYRVDNDIIEVIYLDKLENYNFKQNRGETILLVNKITNNNIIKIKSLIREKNILIVAGENLTEEEFKNTLFISALKNGEKIKLRMLITIISNESILYKIKSGKYENYAIIGEEDVNNPVGGMILNILNNLLFLNNSKNYIVTIYSKNEFDLQDISYIEDAIKEYIDINCNLTFNQVTKLNYGNIVDYFITGEKLFK